jgi:hypothetical protein
MQTPTLLPRLIIADDARLAAQISCVLARPGAYLPIIEGPRLTRPDRDAEIIRRNNAAARARADLILLAGLTDEAADAITNRFRPKLLSKLKRVSSLGEVSHLSRDIAPLHSSILWGRDRIGVGLLKALYGRSGISFSDDPSPTENVPPSSDHLVVCEDGDELSQVIAANYAFALSAGFCLIPATDDRVAEDLLEYFYSLHDSETAPTEALANLKKDLRQRCGPISIPPSGSMTFVTHKLPYGFAYPEAPSTHLISYPDLGVAIINGFAAEQPKTHGTAVAVVVSPDATPAPEIDAAERLLPERGAYLRAYRGPAANVRAVTEMVELFPYDLLVIATHCGDTSGFHWTYEFTDSEGIKRTLVADVAVGFAPSRETDMVGVTQFMRFVSLDGVDWHDPKKGEKLYVGQAILDFMARTQSDARDQLKPVKKEHVSRVFGSAALKMHDHNFISLPRPIADQGTPIIINNACCSWHRLAGNYTFGGARAYIGTLFPVLTSEAHDVAVKLFSSHFGKLLPDALWLTQREVYGESLRRPYIVAGVYPQRLRVPPQDVPAYIERRLANSLSQWRAGLREEQPNSQLAKKARENIAFYEHELAQFLKRRLDIVRRVANL